MKIFSGDSVFVQKKDLSYLVKDVEGAMAIPETIITRLTSQGMFVVTNQSKDDFVEFKELPEISFFQSLDWIVDYSSVKYFSDEELIDMGKRICQERDSIAQCFNAMTYEEQQKNINMMHRCQLLEFKMYSVRDILWLKQGYIKMSLPEEKEYPTSTRTGKGVVGFVKSVISKWKRA